MALGGRRVVKGVPEGRKKDYVGGRLVKYVKK